MIPQAQTAFGRGKGRSLSSASVTNIHFLEERQTQRFFNAPVPSKFAILFLATGACLVYSAGMSVTRDPGL